MSHGGLLSRFSSLTAFLQAVTARGERGSPRAQAQVAMEKQRAAQNVQSSTQRKVSHMIAQAVGIDLRSTTEIKTADDAVRPEVRKESQQLGWASVLRIKVVKARDLAQKNTVTGKSDPYVSVSLGSKEFRTNYIPKCLNPVWNEVHKCVLSKGDMRSTLLVRVFDFDRVLAHQFMGEVRIDMATAVFPQKQWFPLTGRGRVQEEVTGEIFLSISVLRTEHEETMRDRRDKILCAPLPHAHALASPECNNRVAEAEFARDKFAILRENGELRNVIPKAPKGGKKKSIPEKEAIGGEAVRQADSLTLRFEKGKVQEWEPSAPVAHVEPRAPIARSDLTKTMLLTVDDRGDFRSEKLGRGPSKFAAGFELPFAVAPKAMPPEKEKTVVVERKVESEGVKSVAAQESVEKSVVDEKNDAGEQLADENKNVVSDDEKDVASADAAAGSGSEKNVVSEEEQKGSGNDNDNVVSDDEKSDASGAAENVVSCDGEAAAASGNEKNVVSDEAASAAGSGAGEENVVSDDEKDVASAGGSGNEKNVVSEDDKSATAEDAVAAAAENLVTEHKAVEKAASDSGNEANVVSEEQAALSGAEKIVVSEEAASGNENVVSEDEKVAVSEEKATGSGQENVVSNEFPRSDKEKNVVSEDADVKSKEEVSCDERNVVSEDANVGSANEKNEVSEEAGGGSGNENVVSEDEKVAEKSVVVSRLDNAVLVEEMNVVSEVSSEQNVVSEATSSDKNSGTKSESSAKSVLSEEEKVGSGEGGNVVSEDEDQTLLRKNVSKPDARKMWFGVNAGESRALLQRSQGQIFPKLTGDNVWNSSGSELVPVPHIKASYDHGSSSSTHDGYDLSGYALSHSPSPRGSPRFSRSPRFGGKGKEEDDDSSFVLTTRGRQSKRVLADSAQSGAETFARLAQNVFGGGAAAHAGNANTFRRMMGQSTGSKGVLKASTGASGQSSLLENLGLVVRGSATLFLDGKMATCAEAIMDPAGNMQTTRRVENTHHSGFVNKAQRKIDDLRHHTLNDRFQIALARLQLVKDHHTSNAAETISAYQRVMDIAKDFLHVAQSYGKIIITERFLSNEEKTIKPIDVGGRAGGVKYIVSGVLFKFAIDDQNLFRGSDAAAHKVAGHELRGLMCYFNNSDNDVCFPLMALLDYKGFRLICMSLLPIKGSSTLIYGSRDAGRTVAAKDERFNQAMKSAAKRLNLAGCLRGTKEPGVMMHSAIDIEGHLGDDGRYYMLDFARAMPPESPREKDMRQPGDHLYRLLRPEFVVRCRTPLCADAFSNMIHVEPNKKALNADVKEASNQLMKVVIPNYAHELVQYVKEQDMLLGGVQNIEFNQHLHARGINIRFLGEISYWLRLLDSEYAPIANRLVIVEMCARSLKAILRENLRDTMRLYRVPLEQPYVEKLVEFLNVAFGANAKSADFWESLRAMILQKFGLNALPAHGLVDLHKIAMRSNMSKVGHIPSCKMLFLRFQKQMGFELTHHMQRKVVKSPAKLFEQYHPFHQYSIVDMGQRVKSIDVVTQCEANNLLVRGISARDTDDSVRFLRMAESLFKDILASSPNHLASTRQYALCLFYLALNQEKTNEETAKEMGLFLEADLRGNTKMKGCLRLFERVLEMDPEDKGAHLSFAKALMAVGDDVRAEDHLIRCVEIDQCYVPGLRDYAQFLEQSGRQALADEFRERARRVLNSNITGVFHELQGRTSHLHQSMADTELDTLAPSLRETGRPLTQTQITRKTKLRNE